jgi:hypothetical protein
MFGHDAQPSRIYQYRAQRPTGGLDVVREQMRLAHRYRNALVEQEHRRRAAVEAALQALSPDLAHVERQLIAATAAVEGALTALKAAQAEARQKVRPPALVEAVAAAKASRTALYTQRKALRTALFASPAWTERQAAIDAEDLAARKALRASCGCYAFTYLAVEQALGGARRGAPPKFHRWHGEGRLAVQLQGGMRVEDLHAGTDTRLRLARDPRDQRTGRRAGSRHILQVRVASDPQTHGPVWATVPVTLHRPLPADAEIKWTYLSVRRSGLQERWFVEFVLARASGWAPTDRATGGVVALDVGWRLRPSGDLRVAYWYDDAGREGEVTLPAWHLAMHAKIDDLESIRDQRFNVARADLAAWLRTPTAPVPDWLREDTGTLAHWHAQARLARVVLRWRDARFPGDETIYPSLLAWLHKDRHLCDYAAGERRSLRDRREAIYREFAARLRRQYATCVLEAMDLRRFHARPDADQAPDIEATRGHVRHAALSRLVACLTDSMGAVVPVDPARTTMDCAQCGAGADFDRAAILAPCAACGYVEDQDRRAARNLLARWRERVGGEPSLGGRSPA